MIYTKEFDFWECLEILKEKSHNDSTLDHSSCSALSERSFCG